MRLDRFAKLSDEQYRHLLRLPSGRPRCVIDTDTRNEIDDQFALTWALLSQDALEIEAIYAAPYSFLAALGRIAGGGQRQSQSGRAVDGGTVAAGELCRAARTA